MTVPYGAHTFAGFAGVRAPAGEISSESASENPARIAMTSIGARRLATSDKSARPCKTSMVQASWPGCPGHQEVPASVVTVSSSTKKHAMSASTARVFRHVQDRMLTLLTLGHNPAATLAEETFGGCGTY